MKQYNLELRVKNQDAMNFTTEHKTDGAATAILDSILDVLSKSDTFCNAIEYYELSRMEDNKRVVIDENYFV